MSSSSSMLSDLSLKTLYPLVFLGRLAIVSIEFTEMREKGSETLYQVQMLLREAEQKDTCYQKLAKNIVKTREERLKKRE